MYVPKQEKGQKCACISEAALWPGTRLILSGILPSTGWMAEKKNARALWSRVKIARKLCHICDIRMRCRFFGTLEMHPYMIHICLPKVR